MTLIDPHVDNTALSAAPRPPVVLQQVVLDPIVVDNERPEDVMAREALLDRAFGPGRFRKTCQKLRAGRLPARGLSLVARLHVEADGGDVVGTVRLWHVDAGGVPALMLGPLAVDARYRCYGIGRRLMDEALVRAASLGYSAVLLVGDAPYYAKFGFDRRHTLSLRMPGPVQDARFLGFELTAGALSCAKGLVKATGAVDLSRQRPAHRARPLKAA